MDYGLLIFMNFQFNENEMNCLTISPYISKLAHAYVTGKVVSLNLFW